MQSRIVFFLLLVMFCTVGLPLTLGATRDEYVCPPCGCGQDDHVFDKPGVCPVCNMRLVRKGSAAAAPVPMNHDTQNRTRVAILIFDGVQIIDYTGPYEVFGQAGLDVFTVATGSAPITTVMGMRVTPTHTLDDAPDADVLVIPGGEVTAMQESPRVIQWLQEKAKRAEYVLSVCSGAYILANTGLLDGLTATTYYDLIDGLATVAPKVKIVRDQRYVDNGKFITTAGLSSGIDGALHVVDKLRGRGRAQMVALNMEYDWKPDSTYARASFADYPIRNVFGRNLRLPVPTGAEATVQSTAGTTRSWEVEWLVKGEATPAGMLKLLTQNLIDSRWTEQKAANAESTTRSWKFDDQGRKWTGTSEVVATGPQLTTVRLKIERQTSTP